MAENFRACIVEDSGEDRDRLRGFLKAYAEERNYQITVSDYADALDFLEEYRANFDFIFMDIELPHLNEAIPEIDKIVALSTVFNVTTDYLLKSSEINDLSVKTEMLEKLQQSVLIREQRQQPIFAF